MYENNDHLYSKVSRRRTVSTSAYRDTFTDNVPNPSLFLAENKKDHQDDEFPPRSRILAFSKQGPEGFRRIPSDSTWKSHGAPTFLSVVAPIFKKTILVAFGTATILYLLNQKHLLPKPISAVVSRALFWPTLPITYSKRIGKWITVIDDVVVMGGAPIQLLNYPEKLRYEYGVQGVINLCEEYRGPTQAYKRLNMEELYLPTTDHFEPSVEDMIKAVRFIHKIRKSGKGKVYIHCRAGHGRSAAVVYAWLLSNVKDPENVDMIGLNSYLVSLRDVRKTLWKQTNINEFKEWLVLRQN